MIGMFELLIAAAAFVAGAIASVTGFGIGSVLTPVFSPHLGTRLAVAAVSIPHLAATLIRFWMLRRDVDVPVLINFGILSAAGGLAGALLHSASANPILTLIFALLLLFAGVTGLSGYAARMRFGPKTAWIAGAFSGLLGGLVGNQGGIRSAALQGFGLQRQAFVASATAMALIVDLARVPVYFARFGVAMLPAVELISLATIGAVLGTFSGAGLLRRIPERLFHRILGGVIAALGCFMLVRAVQGE